MLKQKNNCIPTLDEWFKYKNLNTKNPLFEKIYNIIEKDRPVFINDEIIRLIGFKSKEKKSRKQGFKKFIERNTKLKSIIEVDKYNKLINNSYKPYYIKPNYEQAVYYIEKYFDSSNVEELKLKYGLTYVNRFGNIVAPSNSQSMTFIIINIYGLFTLFMMSSTEEGINARLNIIHLLHCIAEYNNMKNEIQKKPSGVIINGTPCLK